MNITFSMLELYNENGRWINPLLPLFAIMIIGGIIVSSGGEFEDAGLQADVSRDTAAEKCEEEAKDEVRECALEDGTEGKQIWVCNEQLVWEKWGTCVSK